MKISKYIDIQQEIEVDVTSEEIAQAFDESPDSFRHALSGINNCARFVKAITPEMIAQMNEASRKVIADFFAEQAARFSSNNRDEQRRGKDTA